MCRTCVDRVKCLDGSVTQVWKMSVFLCVCTFKSERSRETGSIVKCWVGVGLVVYASKWLRVYSAVSMAHSMTASLHAAHWRRSAN